MVSNRVQTVCKHAAIRDNHEQSILMHRSRRPLQQSLMYKYLAKSRRPLLFENMTFIQKL
jgi:hypothetical protein